MIRTEHHIKSANVTIDCISAKSLENAHVFFSYATTVWLSIIHWINLLVLIRTSDSILYSHPTPLSQWTFSLLAQTEDATPPNMRMQMYLWGCIFSLANIAGRGRCGIRAGAQKAKRSDFHLSKSPSCCTQHQQKSDRQERDSAGSMRPHLAL